MDHRPQYKVGQIVDVDLHHWWHGWHRPTYERRKTIRCKILGYNQLGQPHLWPIQGFSPQFGFDHWIVGVAEEGDNRNGK
jgi:hypothetical protein